MESAHPRHVPHQQSFLAGSGEMAGLMRSLDWSRTPLGPVEHWPQSLRSALSILLASRAQIVLFWGPELSALYNDAYAPVFGSKHPWALGRPARECWAEVWEPTLRPLFEGVLESGESFHADEHPFFLERHGYIEETYFDVSYDPVRDERGGVGGIFCIVSDATGRVLERRRWQTLRELSIRALSEATSDIEACKVAAETIGANDRDVPFAMIYLIDADRQTARLAAKAGIEPGTPNSPVAVPLTDPATDLWQLGEVASSNLSKVIDTTQVSGLPSGAWDESPRSVLVLPLAAPGHDLPTGLLVAAVSPRRLLDDVYQNFYDTMAGHISTAISHARAYAEERQRSEALAELDRAKTVFFSNVSHEFRTPLTLMLGPMEDLLARSEAALPAGGREQLELMHRNCLRLLKLVNNLLDFSRIEAGRIQGVYEPIDLAAFTAELASVFRSAIERAGLQLVVDCPTLAQPVYVDREMWEKIVLNLLSNALKFTFEGTITVSLSMLDGRVQLQVRDTGTGIAEADLPRVFERFHTVRGAQARTHEGTGIGLALVQELVRLHGGNVNVESALGKGTTFTVTIPAGSAHLPQDRIGGRKTSAATPGRANAYVEEALRWGSTDSESETFVSESTGVAAEPLSKRARILLADDNADMRDYVKRILGDYWRVDAVSDGEAALAAARERPPDLVLTDVMMPGLDGLELLRAIRTDPLTREIPVILLSARAGEESRVEGMQAGADDYLTKPFSARELVAHVSAHLNTARLRREANEALRTSEQRLLMELSAIARIQKVSTRLVQFGDLSAFLHEIIDAAIEITDADMGNIQLLENNALRIVAQRGFEAPFLDFFNTVHEGEAACGAAIASGKRVIVEDVEKSEIFCGTQALEVMLAAGARAVQSTPLITRFGRVLGMFSTHYRSPHRPSEHELHQLDVLARQATDVIERNRAEEVLRENERRFREMVDALPAAVYTTDEQRRLTHFNHAAIDFSGRVPELGTDEWFVSWKLYHPDGASMPHHESPMTVAVREGRPIRGVEAIVERPDGKRISFTCYATPLRDAHGHVVGALNMLVDITDRRQADVAQARLAAIVESSDDAIISKDLQGTIITWNKGAERIFGYTAEEAIGRSVTMLIPADMVDEEPQILKRVRSGQMVDHYETIRRRKDGTLINISLSVSPIRNNLGQIIGASKIAREITQQKRAEQALRQSEERYRSLTAILTSVVWLTNEKGEFAATQSEWEGFTGQSWELYRGRGWIEAFHPEDRAPVEELWRRAIETRSEYQCESRLWHAPSRSYHHVVIRAVPLVNKDGSVREWIGNVQDIHDRKEAEHERETLLAAERAAREAANSASRAKDEFLATVSHELRSPLNAMLGWARLLSGGTLNEETTARALKAIEQNARAQAQLIEDLLDVSRIISGKFRLNVEPVHVVRVIEAAIDSIRPTADAKDISLHATLDPDAGPVSGDAGRLQQVVWNLLSNAVKFTPKGGQVQVRLVRVNSHIEIEVSDTGQGISPEFLPYVFERFRQADGSTTRNHGGLGLGLAIVRHIAELHGGSVAASSPGRSRGSTFSVRLPMMVVHTRHTGEPRVHPKVSGGSELQFTPSPSLDKVRVLVVDDEPEALQLLSTVLTQSGAVVKTASSAAEGFAVIQTWRPNVIVSDIGMPEEDGYSFMRRVKAWARDAGTWIPAVSLTAYARAEDRMRALDSGYQMHVTKPVEPLELIKVLVSLVERPATPWSTNEER